MEPAQSVRASRVPSGVTVTVRWFENNWGMPLLWALGTWETVAILAGRVPTISSFAKKHPIIAGGFLLGLARHFECL